MPRVLLREPLGGGFHPAAVHAALVGSRTDSVWLDGGAHGVSIIALGSAIRAEAPVLSALAAALGDPVEPAEDGGFVGGLVGWLGSSLAAETLDLPRIGDPARDTALLRVDRFARVDAATGQADLCALAHRDGGSGDDWPAEAAAWRDDAARRLEGIRGLPAAPERAAPKRAAPERAPLEPERPEPAEGAWRTTDDDYLAAIAACQRAIREGDAYQLCLTDRVLLPGARPDAVALHRRLRTSSPTHHGALLRIGGVDLVSASPERFLRIRDRVVESSPIKGTRPRGDGPEADAAAAAELLASEKERAENLMIVDLVRNDLSRVCEPSTVEVTRLFDVESYAQVHQLVSTVRGRMREGATVIDAIAALFPAGSMTGAPKRRAVELLAGIEAGARGAYAGAFGWIGADGSADLAMTIRSIVIDEHGTSVGAGGGITALSEPAAELAERNVKAAPLLAALGVRPRERRSPLAG